MPIQQTPDGRRMRLRALTAGLAEGGVTILHQDADGAFDLVENLPPNWPKQEVLGKGTQDIFPDAIAALMGEAEAAAHENGRSQTIEFELPDAGTMRRYQARVRPDIDEGVFAGTLLIISDVTEQRSRELVLTALMREVSHRSKNLLAIVQSVAMQTALHSGSTEQFLARFRGRLHALSSTQDLVTESNWRGTFFKSLVAAQLTRVGQAALGHADVEGDNPLLGPNASLHIGLAIHELATNAILHGTLSEETGHVTVSARKGANGVGLAIEWLETPAVDPRDTGPHRFGMHVLERIVPLAVGGQAHYETREGQIRYQLDIPAGQYET
jgi:two-component sensor histidine kinase